MSKLWSVGLFVKDKDYLDKAFKFTNNLIKDKNEEIVKIIKSNYNFRIETKNSVYKCLVANESIRGHVWHKVFIFNAEMIDNAIIGWYIISRIFPYDIFNKDDSWSYKDYVHYVE